MMFSEHEQLLFLGQYYHLLKASLLMYFPGHLLKSIIVNLEDLNGGPRSVVLMPGLVKLSKVPVDQISHIYMHYFQPSRPSITTKLTISRPQKPNKSILWTAIVTIYQS